jgi:hypothetical protein
MTTPKESAMMPILTPRKSIRNPIIKVAKILGNAKIV